MLDRGAATAAAPASPRTDGEEDQLKTDKAGHRNIAKVLAYLSPMVVLAALFVATVTLSAPGAGPARAAAPPSCGGDGAQSLSTGLQGVGNPGSALLSWNVVSAPNGVPLGVPDAVTADAPWYDPAFVGSLANWIDPNNTGGSTADPTGTYTYQVTIVVFTASTIAFNINYAGADAVAFSFTSPAPVNGDIPLLPAADWGQSNPAYASLKSASYTAMVPSAGSYHLNATVINSAGATGLLVEGTAACAEVPCTGTTVDVSTGTGPGSVGQGVEDKVWHMNGGVGPSDLAYPVSPATGWARRRAVQRGSTQTIPAETARTPWERIITTRSSS